MLSQRGQKCKADLHVSVSVILHLERLLASKTIGMNPRITQTKLSPTVQNSKLSLNLIHRLQPEIQKVIKSLSSSCFPEMFLGPRSEWPEASQEKRRKNQVLQVAILMMVKLWRGKACRIKTLQNSSTKNDGLLFFYFQIKLIYFRFMVCFFETFSCGWPKGIYLKK